jgi:hypothetical protein
MSIPLRIAALLALALLAAGCRKSRLPSEAYRQAQARHVELLGRYAEDGYDRPEADEILALLGQVPDDSLDAESAAELKARILAGQKLLSDRRAARDKALAAAGPITDVASSGGSAAGAGAPAGGGEPAAPRMAPGMKLEDFKAAFGGCFELKTTLEVKGGGAPDAGPQPGEAWGVKETKECQERHAADAKSYVVFTEGVLRTVRPMSDAVRTEVTATKRETIEAVQLPDGGYARETDGGLVPIPIEQIVNKQPK